MLDTVKPVAHRYEYDRMTGEQLSAALNELGLSKREFAKFVGAKAERVQGWLDGTESAGRIPQWVPLILGLLTLPGALELARAYTDSVARDTRTPGG